MATTATERIGDAAVPPTAHVCARVHPLVPLLVLLLLACGAAVAPTLFSLGAVTSPAKTLGAVESATARNGSRVVIAQLDRTATSGSADGGPVPENPPRTEAPRFETSPRQPRVRDIATEPLAAGAGGGGVKATAADCTDYSCFSSKCLANGTSHCAPSPYYVPRTRKIVAREETVCLGSSPPSTPPPLPPLATQPPGGVNPQSKTTTTTTTTSDEKLKIFKHFTARPFQNWYEWGGNWLPPGKSATHVEDGTAEGQFSSGHVGDDNLFILNNVCLRPTGNMAGYKPKIGRFSGADDVYTATKVKKTMKHFMGYLSHVESLPTRPTEFLDTKVVMMPVIGRSSNPGHCFHRTASLFEVRRKAFPNATKEEVTTVFVMPETSRDMASGVSLSDFGALGFTHYTTLATQSHFAVFGHREPEGLKAVFGEAAEDPRLMDLICFKKIAVSFTCTYAECEAARRRQIQRNILPLFYHRSGDLLRDFNEELRKCAGVKARDTPNRNSPTVLLSMRSGNRRWSLTPQIIAAFGHYVTHTLNGTFLVHEMKDATAVDLVRLYNVADMVVSPYGAGLFYSVMMPPGSAALEIAYDHYKCATVNGINRAGNAYCDYGGSFRVVGIHHVLGILPATPSLRIIGDGFASLDLGVDTAMFLFQRAACALRSGKTVPDVDPTCDFGHVEVNRLQQQYLDDSKGDAMKLLLRNVNVSPLKVSSRLGWLYANAQQVAPQLRMVRREVDHARVLIVGMCSRSKGTFAEAAFLHSYLKLNAMIRTWQPPDTAASDLTACDQQSTTDDSRLFPGQGRGPNSAFFRYMEKRVPPCLQLGGDDGQQQQQQQRSGGSRSMNPCSEFHLVLTSKDVAPAVVKDLHRYLAPGGVVLVADAPSDQPY